MITSLIELLELPNVGHMNTSAILFDAPTKILLVMSWTEIMTSQSLFQNVFILRKPRGANFTGTTKIATKFIKTTFNESKLVLKI